MSPSDFTYDLGASQLKAGDLWVSSGYTSVAPADSPTGKRVFGVGNCFAPPFAAGDMELGIDFLVNNHRINDRGSTNKNDCGFLYAEGWWEPGRLTRRGTYHLRVKEQLFSLEAWSHLWPLFDRPGYVLEIELINRSENATIQPLIDFKPGHPNHLEIGKWGFYPPKQGDPADRYNQQRWINKDIVIDVVEELEPTELKHGERIIYRVGVFLSHRRATDDIPEDLQAVVQATDQQRHQRVERITQRMPRLSSSNEDLNRYFMRSLATTLTCTVEHPDFVLTPFPVESGADGGGWCAYPWGVGGYAPVMTTLSLGESAAKLLSLLVGSDLDSYYALTLDGGGVGIAYAYDHFALVSLAETVFGYNGFDKSLFQRLQSRLLSDYDKRPKIKGLLDAGVQENLLEMRTDSWQHVSASPNIEWGRSFDFLAKWNDFLDNSSEAVEFRKKAESIRKRVVDVLWDEEHKTFKSLYPDGSIERVHSIQLFDVYRCGVPNAIGQSLLDRLVDDDFLAPYGLHSVSRIDTVHFERNDPDWSGGGAYTGELPQLATILWEKGQDALAWNVLQRAFWMGRHLPYFPQEHYCERPDYPTHKRNACVAGGAGAESIIYGLFGIRPQHDGTIIICPADPPCPMHLDGIHIRKRVFKVNICSETLSISIDGETFYNGPRQEVIIPAK